MLTERRRSVVGLLTLAILLGIVLPASAQDLKFDEQTAVRESQAATTTVIKILVGGVLVIVLIAAIIYGIARGMTQGNWGFFAACVIAVIVAVLAVKGIANFFGLDLQNLMKR